MAENYQPSLDLFSELCGFFGGEISRHILVSLFNQMRVENDVLLNELGREH
jgi:hypothetical protein